MARRGNSDRTLEDLKAEWRKSRKKFTLSKALTHCRDHRLPEPPWLEDAYREVGRAQIARMKTTGRKTDLLKDDVIYATVEEYRRQGLTQKKAFTRTAREYYGNRSQDLTVKSAWLRHRKRIAFDHLPDGIPEWRIKDKYLRSDRNAVAAKDAPAYLRTKKK